MKTPTWFAALLVSSAFGLMPLTASGMSSVQKNMTVLQHQTQQVLARLTPGLTAQQTQDSIYGVTDVDGMNRGHRRLPPALVDTLNVLNRALYQQAHQAGLLTQTPELRTQSMKGADVWVLPGLQGQTCVSSAVLPDSGLHVPGANRLNPVYLRWFVLLHEAAHTELGNMNDPFVDPSWDPQANRAMSRLLTDPGRLGNQTFGVFDETFADTYGALMLLRLAPNTPQAVAVVRSIERMRAYERTHRIPVVLDGLFDPHAQVAVLKQLSVDTHRTSFLGWIKTATPEQLRQAALWQTSMLVEHWIKAHKPRFAGDFGWAAPQSVAVGTVTAQLRLRAFRIQRALSYVLDPKANPEVAVRQAMGMPLFKAQLANDKTWRASFVREVSPQTRRMLKRFIEGKGSDQALAQKDFVAWVNNTHHLDLRPGLIQKDQHWLAQRYQLVAKSLQR